MAEQRITETIEFKTQIHTAWDNTEQRMALREHPRRSISYRYTGMTNRNSEYLRALCNGQQTQQIEFPLWQATRLLPQTRYDQQAHIQLETRDMWDYRDCHAVMLVKDYNGVEASTERFNLKSIEADGFLQTKKTFSNDWPEGKTLVVPVFWGVLNQEDSYTNVTSHVADLCLNIEVMPSITAVTLPEAVNEYNYPRLKFEDSLNADNEYNGYELFMFPPSWLQDQQISYSRNANKLDNDTGYFRYDLKSSATTTTRSMDFYGLTKDEIHFLQRFFYRCKGQWKSFYMPTWTSDIKLADNAYIGDSVMYGKFEYYYRYYTSNNRRKLIIVFFEDGTIQIIEIAGWTVHENGKMSKIYLQTALQKNLLVNQIKMISFLCKVRHNSDTMTTSYETNETASITFEVKEVDG